jgi:hypothetical protein
MTTKLHLRPGYGLEDLAAAVPGSKVSVQMGGKNRRIGSSGTSFFDWHGHPEWDDLLAGGRAPSRRGHPGVGARREPRQRVVRRVRRRGRGRRSTHAVEGRPGEGSESDDGLRADREEGSVMEVTRKMQWWLT